MAPKGRPPKKLTPLPQTPDQPALTPAQTPTPAPNLLDVPKVLQTDFKESMYKVSKQSKLDSDGKSWVYVLGLNSNPGVPIPNTMGSPMVSKPASTLARIIVSQYVWTSIALAMEVRLVITSCRQNISCRCVCHQRCKGSRCICC